MCLWSQGVGLIVPEYSQKKLNMFQVNVFLYSTYVVTSIPLVYIYIYILNVFNSWYRLLQISLESNLVHSCSAMLLIAITVLFLRVINWYYFEKVISCPFRPHVNGNKQRDKRGIWRISTYNVENISNVDHVYTCYHGSFNICIGWYPIYTEMPCKGSLSTNVVIEDHGADG